MIYARSKLNGFENIVNISYARMRRNGFVSIVHMRAAVAKGVRNLLAYESRRQTARHIYATRRCWRVFRSFQNMFGIFSDLELEAEAVYEITEVFPLLFLLGRAR